MWSRTNRIIWTWITSWICANWIRWMDYYCMIMIMNCCWSSNVRCPTSIIIIIITNFYMKILNGLNRIHLLFLSNNLMKNTHFVHDSVKNLRVNKLFLSLEPWLKDIFTYKVRSPTSVVYTTEKVQVLIRSWVEITGFSEDSGYNIYFKQ